MLQPEQTINLKVALGTFPSDFVWGAATAAYQIEGATSEDGRGESIWDRFSHTPGKVVNGDTGDMACDHYHRWREDIALMQKLGLNAYRFSIAWPRILPQGTGIVNQAGLDFYSELVDGLLAAGITPWATLYHWDLPQALEDAGGWTNRATADAFAEYTEVITRHLGDRVKHWITLNEPWCSAHLGYGQGEHAPGHTEPAMALTASHVLLLAHGKAVDVVRRTIPDAQVGITLNLSTPYPASQAPEDVAAADRWDQFFNRWYLGPLYGRGYPEELFTRYGASAPSIEPGDLEQIAVPTDFLGINYYSPAFVVDNPADTGLGIAHATIDDGEFTEMGWLVYPQGLYDLLASVQQIYNPPALYVTENGSAYIDEVTQEASGGTAVDDPQRTRYLAQHIAACREAINNDVALKGYFAWSLMDNFEWGFGFGRRFGLIHVDYTTQRRTIKESGKWYGTLLDQQSAID